MKNGSWEYRGRIKGLRLGQYGLIASLALLASQQGLAGFSLGNGQVVSLGKSQSYLVQPFGGTVLEVRSGGNPALMFAPKSDGVLPRTKITVAVAPVFSLDQAFQGFLKANSGWVTFVKDSLSGAYRETQTKSGISRLEIQYFFDSEKLLVVLEGKKQTSKAYAVAAEQLLEDIGEELE